MKNNLQKAYFAAGCFWGVEYCFQEAKGVVSTRVGYMGGEAAMPTYEEVCGGKTGHAETLEVIFDAEKTSFEDLARLFFEIHDPTQKDRQGPDLGRQYRSVIFYTNEEQKNISLKLIRMLRDKEIDAVTEIVPATVFYPAEEYHQRYYNQTGQEPYCHARRRIF